VTAMTIFFGAKEKDYQKMKEVGNITYDGIEYWSREKEWPPWTLKERLEKERAQRMPEIKKRREEREEQFQAEEHRLERWLELCIEARNLGKCDYETWQFMVMPSEHKNMTMENRLEIAEKAYTALKEASKKEASK